MEKPLIGTLIVGHDVITLKDLCADREFRTFEVVLNNRRVGAISSRISDQPKFSVMPGTLALWMHKDAHLLNLIEGTLWHHRLPDEILSVYAEKGSYIFVMESSIEVRRMGDWSLVDHWDHDDAILSADFNNKDLVVTDLHQRNYRVAVTNDSLETTRI